MKKLKVISVLLATAILCLCFVSCAKNKPGANGEDESFGFGHADIISGKNTEPSTTEEVTTAPTQSTTAKEEKSTSEPLKTTTTKPQKESTTPTLKPTTTAPPTSAVHTTTTAPIVESTTPAPTTTAAPETTTTETTTAPSIMDGEDNAIEKEVLRLINEERSRQGLSLLTYSDELAKAADTRVKELKENFAHERPDGSLWNTVSDLANAENIAMGQSSPQMVVSAWLNSAGHKANILNPDFTISAVGCFYDSSSNVYYWVQLLGY